MFRAIELAVKRIISIIHTTWIKLLVRHVKLGEGTIVYYRSSIVNVSRLGGD